MIVPLKLHLYVIEANCKSYNYKLQVNMYCEAVVVYCDAGACGVTSWHLVLQVDHPSSFAVCYLNYDLYIKLTCNDRTIENCTFCCRWEFIRKSFATRNCILRVSFFLDIHFLFTRNSQISRLFQYKTTNCQQ